MKQLLIFVAGPYSADDDDGISANVAAACAAGKTILEKGHIPFIAHLSVAYDLWHEDTYGERAPADLYYAWDLAMLERCEGLLSLAPSPGANRELARAQELRLPIWTDVDGVPQMSEQTDALFGGPGRPSQVTVRHPVEPICAIWIGGDDGHWEIWSTLTTEELYTFPRHSAIDNGEWALSAYAAVRQIERAQRKLNV